MIKIKEKNMLEERERALLEELIKLQYSDLDEANVEHFNNQYGSKSFELTSSIDPNKSDIEEVFCQNGSYWVKRKCFDEPHKCNKEDILIELNNGIVKDVVWKYLLKRKLIKFEMFRPISEIGGKKLVKWKAKRSKIIKKFKLIEGYFVVKNKDRQGGYNNF